MIPPALLVAWVGPVPVILPIVLLWPLLALAWVGLGLLALFGRGSGRDLPSVRVFHTALHFLGSLRGLRIDLRTHTGPSITFRLY